MVKTSRQPSKGSSSSGKPGKNLNLKPKCGLGKDDERREMAVSEESRTASLGVEPRSRVMAEKGGCLKDYGVWEGLGPASLGEQREEEEGKRKNNNNSN